ncbi:MAG: pyridoxal 5'-phosphate synthase glutaminase subunit PdxT [Candidatus Marinimicrobia bacterium]|nr:pyridoxal 5'-phosphate synthase glutaminase subunit PdxT [Candidatus Neomarinimicrobiota bacterium]|tara:strand:+ start:3118 stop:3693 length:576 start_codon:yes stop_codon:yes gene_type:complete
MVGVLALQGDFQKHKSILNKIGVESTYVKNVFDLRLTNSLIIPGGESTVLSMLLDRFSLREPILKYAKRYSIFGTCAGMIMLSKTKNLGYNINPLALMDFTVSRNSWGSQISSFHDNVNLKNFKINNFDAIFIRAPKVVSFEKNLKIDYIYENEPVIIEDNNHLACSFHPELNGDVRLHKYFLDKFYYEKR